MKYPTIRYIYRLLCDELHAAGEAYDEAKEQYDALTEDSPELLRAEVDNRCIECRSRKLAAEECIDDFLKHDWH